jgi:serine/threonine protein kinase/ketosteroid isomerase-like protein
MKVCPSCHLCFEETYILCAKDQCQLVSSHPATPSIAKKYRLDWLLGRGRLGAVFEGTNVETDRRVAIKLLSPDFAGRPEVLKQFRAAAYAVAHLNTRIDHQHVVKTYDYGTLSDGTPYIVMELVEGDLLHELLERNSAFPLDEAVGVARQIADGLEAAHRCGVVHGNLKPTNIFAIRDRHGRPEVKILNFGFARLRSLLFAGNGTRDQRDSELETSYYLSPEQRGGRYPDERADFFSLGIILYEMLAGSPVSTWTLDGGAVNCSENLTPLTELREDVSESLWQLVKQSLNEKPTERPGSAAEVARQLLKLERPEPHYLASQPALAAAIAEPKAASNDFHLPASGYPPQEQGEDLPTSWSTEHDEEIQSGDTLLSEDEPYFEEMNEEPEEVGTVIVHTPPESRFRIPALPLPVLSFLNSVPPLLANAGKRLNTPVSRRLPFVILFSLTAILAGAIALNWASSTRSHVSQAKSNAAPVQTAAPRSLANDAAVLASVPSTSSVKQVPQPAGPATPVPTQSSPPPTLEYATAEPVKDESQPESDEGEEKALRAVFDQWLAATNNRDLESQMNLYTAKMDAFYNSRNASLNAVRAHKSSVYTKASSIDMRASEPEILIEDDGQKATMRFHKKWIIKGKNSSRGEATQELKLLKTEDGWKITGERNVSGE